MTQAALRRYASLMSDHGRDPPAHGAARGAFVHEPLDSPTPEPVGSLAELIRRLLAAPRDDRRLNKQVRFLLEMLRMGQLRHSEAGGQPETASGLLKRIRRAIL